MSDKGYTVNDRRGGNDSGIQEACRVCGGPVHTREYNQPTMECIKFLRDQVTKLSTREFEQPRLFKWYPDAPPGSDVKARHGVYFESTDLTVTDTGQRATGQPTWKVEWCD